MCPISWRWVAFLLAAGTVGLSAQVPGILTYEGRVLVAGEPFNGVGLFKFALVNGGVATTTSYWSHDGSSLNGSEPGTALTVGVSDGFFQIGLGDTNLVGMAEVPAGVFDQPDVRLRLWFDDGVNGMVQLAPDQRVTSAGYALRAAGTPDGAISAAMLAPASVQSAQIADGAVTSIKIATPSIHTTHLGDGVVTTPKLADGAVTQEKIADGAVTAVKLAPGALGSVSVPDPLSLHTLHIENAAGLDRIDLLGANGDAGILRMNHGSIGRFLEATGTTDGGFFRLYDFLGGAGIGQTTVELGSSSVGGYVRVFQDNKSAGLQLSGQNGSNPGGLFLAYRESGLGAHISGQNRDGGGEIVVYNAASSRTVEIVGAEENNPGGQVVLRRGDGRATIVLDGQLGPGGGEISVRNGDGRETVQVLGNEGADNPAGQIRILRSDGAEGIVLDGQIGQGGGDGEGGGDIGVYNASGQRTIRLRGTEGDGAAQIEVRQSDGQIGVLVDGQFGSSGGQVMINNQAGQTRINLVGQVEGGGGYLGIRDANGTVTAQIHGAEIGTQGAQITLAKANGAQTVFLDAELGAGGGSLRLAKSDGSIPIRLDASAGGGGRVTTQVLEITGGSDLSEQFDVRSENEPPAPGEVVCIDPAHPGRLVLSSRAYDRTVAGVISGAGGVQPGMLMSQAGSAADGRHPVALTGRVYCWVDASAGGAVAPGDLLTTSSTPGHAMKASEPGRAAGAVLGKALSPLPEGRGLVLVLVSLQ